MHNPAIYELRNYLMKPDGRDVLIDLFERHFIESQEELGSRVVATFRDLDRPDRFVWMRAFDDMGTRAAALDGFYTGEIWRAHRNAANATMIDSDDVLLLRPVSGNALATDRAPIGASPARAGTIVATTHFLPPGEDAAFGEFFTQDVAPALKTKPFATFATEHSANSYPRLPIRENETVFVTLTLADAAVALDAALEAEIARRTLKPAHIMRLEPTARSALR